MISRKYKNLSIIVVEDDKPSAQQMVEVFEIYFDNVYISYNGCDALDIIDKYIPDIIVSDIDMPCLNGIEMVEHLQNSQRYKETVFMLITAYPTEDNLLKTINFTHVDAIFSKPVNLKKLLTKIEELLNEKNENIDLKELLSPKEYDVFLDFAKGLKPMSIADKYDIKPKTVSTYKQRILNKLNLKSTRDIVYYAIKNDCI